MNIILLGAPGAGKGTQAEMISNRYNLPKLSTGDMIRQEISNATDLGKEVKQIVDSGEFVSDEIMIKLVDKRLVQPDARKGVIFDGFPRTTNQAESLEELLEKHYANASYLAISLQVADEEIIKRVGGRFTCADCGVSYHDIYKKTKIEEQCDECDSSSFARREDDKPESIEKRISVYKEKYTPVFKYYEDKGVLKIIDGMQAINLINGDIVSLIDEKIVKSDYMNYENRG